MMKRGDDEDGGISRPQLFLHPPRSNEEDGGRVEGGRYLQMGILSGEVFTQTYVSVNDTTQGLRVSQKKLEAARGDGDSSTTIVDDDSEDVDDDDDDGDGDGVDDVDGDDKIAADRARGRWDR